MTILLDVDGVLANFTKAACREMSEILERNVSPSECKRWDFDHNFGLTNRQAVAFDRRIRRKGFCAGLEVLPGAVKAVQALSKIGQVFFVTTPWRGSDYWMAERAQWVADYMGYNVASVIHTFNKEIIRGEVIIDDKPHNVAYGERLLRVLVPNAANKVWRDTSGWWEEDSGLLVSKNWKEIIAAVKEVENE